MAEKHDLHVLRSRALLGLIADLAEPLEGRWVFEIGSGPGNLTSVLLERGAQVIGIEISQEFVKRLSGQRNFTLIVGDVARINFPTCDVVVGNIPYSVTSGVLRGLVKSDAKKAVLTIQLEVARRLMACPGTREYGSLTVYMHGWTKKIAKRVSPEAFSPPPRVESAIVVLERKEMPPAWVSIEKDPGFEAFLKWIFSRRKKMLRKILPVNDTRRPFMLSPKEIAEFYMKFKSTWKEFAKNRRARSGRHNNMMSEKHDIQV